MNRPPLKVADIIRAVGDGFIGRNESHLSWPQLKVLRAIRNCRTQALGGHLDRCSGCGHEAISYNSCFAANRLDLPVSDQTHVDGFYTFSLEWSRDGLRTDGSGDANPDGLPSFFTSIEQIGLKLESRKAPLDILVVDSAERPTEN